VDPFEGLLKQDPPSAVDAEAYKRLKQIPLFRELAFPDVQALFRICMHVSFSPNTVIIEQGVPGAGLMVIVHGNADVMRVNGDLSVPLAMLGPGEALGEVSLLDASPTSARVVAATAVNALFMRRESLMTFLSTRDAAALRILRVLNKTLADRLRAANLR
jgi:CRP-like cAMP-binding protein